MTFESEVEADRDSFFRGRCVQLEYGRTPTGQQFATLITKGIWYAVRVYMEEDHSELTNTRFQPRDRFLFKSQHATWNDATGKVVEYRRQLETGDYKAFLCNLPSVERHTRDAGPTIGGISVVPGHRFTNQMIFSLFDNLFDGEALDPLNRVTFETRDFSSALIIKKTPSDCATHPDNYLKRGDIVQANWAMAANHEGIYIGNGKVIHVSGHGEGKAASMAREGQLLGDFVSNASDAIRVLVLRVRFRTPEEIVEQAEAYRDQRFRAGEFDLFAQNCQHFATLCAFGVEYCGDLERFRLNFSQLVMAARNIAPVLLLF